MPGYEVVTCNILDQKMHDSGHFRLPFIPTGTKFRKLIFIVRNIVLLLEVPVTTASKDTEKLSN